MANELTLIGEQVIEALNELINVAGLKPGQILVVGCSTSVVQGEKMGSAGSVEVAGAILQAALKICNERGINLAVQCCEHLNRALVVEAGVAEKFGLDEVRVVPVPKAGGALASQAMRNYKHPVVVEEIKAHAGLDIGGTLIGMHLKRVAVPVKLRQQCVGAAPLTAGYSRPKLIGGARAVYELPAN